MNMKIPELFTAMYDTRSGKIIGCKKNSLVYLHEYRHQQQFNSKFGIFYGFFETYLIRVIGGAFVLVGLISKTDSLLLFAGAGLTLIIPTFFMMVFELDAWLYAILKYKTKESYLIKLWKKPIKKLSPFEKIIGYLSIPLLIIYTLINYKKFRKIVKK